MEQLKVLMQELNLSVPDVAHLAGVHVSTVFRWLSRKSRVPKTVLAMLLRMLEDREAGR
jgi:DNA-binding transcriptional regulator YiaG